MTSVSRRPKPHDDSLCLAVDLGHEGYLFSLLNVVDLVDADSIDPNAHLSTSHAQTASMPPFLAKITSRVTSNLFNAIKEVGRDKNVASITEERSCR